MNTSKTYGLRNPAFHKMIYFSFFKSTSNWFGFILFGAIVSEMFTEGITTYVWKKINKGKFWEDVLEHKKLTEGKI